MSMIFVNPQFKITQGKSVPNFGIQEEQSLHASEKIRRAAEYSVGYYSQNSVLLSYRTNAIAEGDNLEFPGLVGLAYHCWAQEKCMLLEPHMVYDRFLSECTSIILQNVEENRSLFTDSDGKKNIVIELADPTEMSINALTDNLLVNVKSAQLKEIMMTRFSTDTIESVIARKYAFCQSATPYFNYITTLCGIPAIKIGGLYSDWKQITDMISNAKNIIKAPESSNWELFCDNFLNICNRIADSFLNGQEPFPGFVSNIICNERNPKCGSEHTDNIVSGWLCFLYRKIGIVMIDHIFDPDVYILNTFEASLSAFDSDVHYVPYENKETGHMFYKACGVYNYTASIKEDGREFNGGSYTFIKCQIMDPDLFCKMAKKDLTPSMVKHIARCDICELDENKKGKGIVGVRYKCMTCPDYDLCSTCFMRNEHKEHAFVALRSKNSKLQTKVKIDYVLNTNETF